MYCAISTSKYYLFEDSLKAIDCFFVYEQFLCFRDPNSNMTFPLAKCVTVYSLYWNINVPEVKLNLCLHKCFRTMLVWLLHYLHSFTFASIALIFLRLTSHCAFKSIKNLNFGSLITLSKTCWACLYVHFLGLTFFLAYCLLGKLGFLPKIQTQQIVCPEEDASEKQVHANTRSWFFFQ